MKKTRIMNESSLMYRKIDAFSLLELDRTRAVGALAAAYRLVDACQWLAEQLVRIATPNAHLPANVSAIPHALRQQ